MKRSAAALIIALIVMPQLAQQLAWSISNVTKEFDQIKVTTIQGVITNVEWVNPHAWLTFESKDANGLRAKWRVEMAAAGVLFKNGIRREDLKLAKFCSMEIWPARNGTKTAYGWNLTFAAGKCFDVHERFFEPVPLCAPAK